MTQPHAERRIERDTLGEVQVPARAYYGAQTQRALENFAISGQGLPRELVWALGSIKAAAAAELGARGELNAELAAAIERAAQEVAAGSLDAHFVVDVFQTGSGTSSHMNANEVIANRAAELLGLPLGQGAVHPNDHVNRGQSSNDVFPSAVQLALGHRVQVELLPAVDGLAEVLHALAEGTFEDVKSGRTHLMDALPIRFGQVFRGYAQQMERARARIAQAGAAVLELPLGGTAVGTGANAPAGFAAAVCARLARATGLPVCETTAHLQAQASADLVVHLSAAVRTAASALYKIANDVRWMASGPHSGLSEVELPALQPGSSIMPAKVNPVVCEAVLMATAQVLGDDQVVAFANSQGQFELNTMWPLLARNALEAVRLLGGAASALAGRTLSELIVSPSNGERVAHSPMLATALAPRIGYAKATAIAKEAAASGRTVREVAGELSGLPAHELDALLDPKRIAGDFGKQR